MYTVLLKTEISKPCPHLKLIMTQKLNIFLTTFAKLALPHTKYMFLARLYHQAQLTMQKLKIKGRSRLLFNCFMQKLRAQPKVYLWVSLFRPRIFSASLPLHTTICSCLSFSNHWSYKSCRFNAVCFKVSQMVQLPLPSSATIQA